MPSRRQPSPRGLAAFVTWSAIACLPLTAAPLLAQATYTGRVVAVHDGDTVTVATATGRIKVRLAGIDSPEVGQKWASQARDFTASLVLNRTVVVESSGSDQYGRVLGDVRVNGVDVNEAVVRQGLAWPVRPRQRGPAHRCRRAGGPRRARGPMERPVADASVAVAPHTSSGGCLWLAPGASNASKHADRTSRVDVRDARGPFHGNTRSRLFHRPGCPHYNCKGCDDAFLTVQSAEEAGYRPAGDCLRDTDGAGCRCARASCNLQPAPVTVRSCQGFLLKSPPRLFCS